MAARPVRLFLAGDVMPGRGVDQILAHPGDPALRERYVRDAREYVALAEAVNGSIATPVSFDWPWGSALRVLDDIAPDIRIINLECGVTSADAFAPGKAVHYRMHPANLPVVLVARPDVCVLANNHVLDFGANGLTETLEVLSRAGLRWVGAGRDADEARRPVAVTTKSGTRVLVFAYGMASSGIPPSWAATADRPGVNFVSEASDRAADEITDAVRAVRRPGDVVIMSLHWGSNWGYHVPADQIRFAHRMLEHGVDVVYGHSAHHPRPIEIHRGKLVLYGCGDLVDDYEGISGYEQYRDDLRLLYFPTVEPETGRLVELRMAPVRARRMRLCPAAPVDVEWLRSVLDRQSARFGTLVDLDQEGALVAREWT